MRFKCVAVFCNRYMPGIIDYRDNMRSSRRVLCVVSQIINSSNGLSCKLHNVIIIFILYGLYTIDLLSLCVKII